MEKILKNRKILLISIILLLSITKLFAVDNKVMSVTIKTTQVRSRPSFLGKVLYNLEYTNRVEILESISGWFLVKSDKNIESGWVSSSALTEKKLVLNSNASDIDMNASGSEVALAGKGFNSQVEESYKNGNGVDYTWIDKMELIEIPIEDVIVFLEDGNITSEEL